jgi:hypothetical protein
MSDYIKDTATGKIRLTRTAIEEKRSRFARAGIDIRTIDTEEKLEQAMKACKNLWTADFVNLVEGHPGLEKGNAPRLEIVPAPQPD